MLHNTKGISVSLSNIKNCWCLDMLSLMNPSFINSLMFYLSFPKMFLVILHSQCLLCIQTHSFIPLRFQPYFHFLVLLIVLLFPLDDHMLLSPHVLPTIALVILSPHLQVMVLLQRSFLLCIQKII